MNHYWISLLLALVTFSGCKEESKSPCILQATYDHCGFIFRRDNTYEWYNGISSDQGNYKRKDNLITLDRSNFDSIVKTKYLLIAENLPWTNMGTSGKFIIQVDNNKKAIDSFFVFKVYIDLY